MKRWWNEKDLLQFDNEKIISKDITVNDVVEMILNEFTSCMYENIFFIFKITPRTSNHIFLILKN